MVSVLPIYFVLLLGFFAQKRFSFDIRSLSGVAIYLFYPFLAFRVFYENPLKAEHGYLALFAVLLCLVMILFVHLVSFFGGYTKSQRSAGVLAGVFMNAGNYGAPVILFAFGETAFSYAVVLMVIQSLLMNSVGLYYAAVGAKEGLNPKEAIRKVLTMPILYGCLLGIVVQMSGWKIPEIAGSTVSFLADATIPLILLTLGMHLSTITFSSISKKDLFFTAGTKMIVSPIIGTVMALLLPVDPLIQTILIITSFMPTAANTTLFALQFNTEPDLVAASTLFTTALSTVTLPSLLLILGN